jgi:5'-deoxynucleotidase YfbR-like HD superfamily hydrolase
MVSRHNVYRSTYLAGCVKRYSTWPMIQPQTVGHHCWRVACIFVEIFGMPRAEVLYYCLHHDSGELFAGDVPFGVKKQVQGLKESMDKAEAIGLHLLGIKLPQLSKEELAQVKICDYLEMHETGEHELNLGNLYAEDIVADTMHAAQRLANESCMSQRVNDWLRNRGSVRHVR